MKTKDLLNEWKNFLNKEMINEVSLKIFQQQHPDFDTSSFSSQLRGNTDYLDIISNTINAGQNHGPEDFVQQFEFYKNSIEPNRNSQDFLTIDIPGEDIPVSLHGKLNQGSCTATFDDIQQFQQARMFVLGKGSKNKLNSAYIKVLEEANDSDFELVAENSDWIIYYPKSVKGSISLARSYWDGSKIAYDSTFNSSKGFGKNTGLIGWCTSASGAGNMFLNYHRKYNLHMYYCIKKRIRSVKDPDRKLCISFSKNSKQNPSIQYYEGTASVNADNKGVSKRYSKNKLGSLFDNLLKDVAESKRLEIDSESYYKSISFDQYIIMRNANEENISDFQHEAFNILRYSRESDKIAYHVAKDSNNEIRNVAARNPNTPSEVLSILAKDEDTTIRNEVARNPNTPPEVLSYLSKDKDTTIRNEVARNPNTPPEVLSYFVKDEDIFMRMGVASNPSTPPEVLSYLSKDKDVDIRRGVAYNDSSPPEALSYLSKDKDITTRVRVLHNASAPPEVLSYFVKDEDAAMRVLVARNDNTPSEALSILAKDEDTSIRNEVACNPNTPPEVLSILAKDKSKNVRNHAIKRLENIKNESILRAYIKLIMS